MLVAILRRLIFAKLSTLLRNCELNFEKLFFTLAIKRKKKDNCAEKLLNAQLNTAVVVSDFEIWTDRVLGILIYIRR